MLRQTLSFTVDEYKDRLERVRGRMADAGIDALIVSTPENICYLSGYRTVGYYYLQVLVVTVNRDPVLVMRLFELRNAHAFAWLDHGDLLPYNDTENPVDVIAGVIRDLGLAKGRLGVEKSFCSFLPIDRYEELMTSVPEADFVNGFGLIEAERMIKSSAEIAYIRRSCEISGIGLGAAREHCRAGITENELSAHIHKAMIEQGSEYPGLPVFLGSGERTHIPHVQWTDKLVEAGDNVPVELTGVTHRYAGPLFRTFAVGPSAKMDSDFQVMKDQLEAAIEAIRPGITSADVDAAAKRAAQRHDRLHSFTKRTGYSVGLNYPPDWGEGHFLDLKEGDETALRAGMVFHIPMSLRADEDLTVAVSETVMVTNDGHEVLTDFPRELIVV